jgi:hypothetical protein
LTKDDLVRNIANLLRFSVLASQRAMRIKRFHILVMPCVAVILGGGCGSMSFSGHERHEGGYMLLRPMVGVMMVTAMVRNFTRLSHVRILGMDSYGFHSNRKAVKYYPSGLRPDRRGVMTQWW